MQQGILASFVAMPGLVFYNFARTSFVDIPSVLFTAGAFIAILKKVDLAYILQEAAPGKRPLLLSGFQQGGGFFQGLFTQETG